MTARPSKAPQAVRAVAKGKRSTINDIARLANVSKKTVSRVINDSPFVKAKTREKVREIIGEIGFTPDPQARGLAFRRAFLIGMVYDNPSPQYIVNVQQGVLDALRGTSFELVIRPSDRTAPGFLEDIRHFVERQKPFGVVLPPPVSEDERLIRLLDELSCPYVRIASLALGPAETMVVALDYVGGMIAARYLAELGHRQIGHISGPSTFRSAQERRRGFTDGLGEKGLKLPRKFDREAGYTFDTGYGAAKSLLAGDERPTAIFAGNDEMALGVYKAAREAGLDIPADLSVIGFDDNPMAVRAWPLLTTIKLPIRDMGRMAAEKLLALSKERKEPAEPTEIVPTLVMRDSAARPR